MLKCILSTTFRWFKIAVRVPQDKNIHTQLGVHLEEVCEMLEEVETSDPLTAHFLLETRSHLTMLANHLKSSVGVIEIPAHRRQDYLDAICDQIVTATGCACMSELDILGAMSEVNRSNFSKFDDTGHPIFGPNKKIMKGSDYTKPDLSAFV